MKYAIVENGGKQYKAVEGETIEVDRLPVNAGDKFDLERVLMLVDGEDVSVGTPTVDGIKISTTVVNHFKGPKLTVFKYSPRKRIRVKGGHRQQYTRLMVETIGGGKAKAATKAKKAEPVVEKAEAKAEKIEATAKKPAAKKTEKAPAKKETTAKAKTTKKAPATSSPKGKKTTAKKTTTRKSTTTKKTSSTKKTEK